MISMFCFVYSTYILLSVSGVTRTEQSICSIVKISNMFQYMCNLLSEAGLRDYALMKVM